MNRKSFECNIATECWHRDSLDSLSYRSRGGVVTATGKTTPCLMPHIKYRAIGVKRTRTRLIDLNSPLLHAPAHRALCNGKCTHAAASEARRQQMIAGRVEQEPM